MRTSLISALLLMTAAACSGGDTDHPAPAGGDPLHPRPRIIYDVPIIARSRQLDTTGTPEAERSTWQVAQPYGLVTGYYRRELVTLGYTMISDRGDSLTTDLYARKVRRDLWMHFEKKGPDLTEWTIIGAAAPIPDSTRLRPLPKPVP